MKMMTSDKEILLVTTQGCEACEIMKRILSDICNSVPLLDARFTIRNYKNVDNWINTNVKFNDFPTTIFIKDNTIKYVLEGTKSKSKILDIIKNINY